jgi:hypothetical protein
LGRHPKANLLLWMALTPKPVPENVNEARALARWMPTSEVCVLEVFRLQIIALPDLVVASTACIARVNDTNSSTLVIKPQTRAWLQTSNFSPTLRWNIKKPPFIGGG